MLTGDDVSTCNKSVVCVKITALYLSKLHELCLHGVVRASWKLNLLNFLYRPKDYSGDVKIQAHV